MDRECGQGLEWREAEEVEWGDVLRVSQRGMWASRGFLWEEAARNVACLLACPAAWDGDHFLQVSRRPPEYSYFLIISDCLLSRPHSALIQGQHLL
jgi:hypothetical protein